MKCKQCDFDLMIAKSDFKSELNSTDVFSVQTLVCVNPNCSFYAGKDLSDPLHIAETISTKIN